MPIPALALAAGGTAASAIGGLLNQDGVPGWLVDQIREYVARTRSSSFLPDQEMFSGAVDAQVGDYLQDLPIQLEEFRAQQAARGTFTSGEALPAEYANVYRPIASRIGAITAQSNLDFSRLSAQVGLQKQAQELQALQLLTQATLNKKPGILGTLGGVLQGGGKFASQLGMLQLLGLVEPFGDDNG